MGGRGEEGDGLLSCRYLLWGGLEILGYQERIARRLGSVHFVGTVVL